MRLLETNRDRMMKKVFISDMVPVAIKINTFFILIFNEKSFLPFLAWKLWLAPCYSPQLLASHVSWEVEWSWNQQLEVRKFYSFVAQKKEDICSIFSSSRFVLFCCKNNGSESRIERPVIIYCLWGEGKEGGVGFFVVSQ